ncbi:sugar tyrosine-protein kinase [Marinilabiliaceae bacterium JC017]|nr:sugar tyrosine-protein kinase [Marinilabiliaceae bacterium JC017]
MSRLCNIYFWVICLEMLFQFGLQAQDLSDLNKEKKQIEKKIALSSSLLKELDVKKTSSLQSIRILNAQIQERQKLVSVFKREIDVFDAKITQSEQSISLLNKEINKAKSDYSKLIRTTYRRSRMYNEFAFFLGSDSFNEAYRRYIYLKQYNRYRRNQGHILMESKAILQKEVGVLKKLKRKKTISLSNIQNEKVELEKNIASKNKFIQSAIKKEKILRQQLRQNELVIKNLERKIVAIISNVKEKKGAFSEFNRMMGMLEWPVDNGIVVSKFGEHAHPMLKQVKIKNNGVDIQAAKGSEVFSIFDGEVSRVVGIPGYNKAVIIRHGKFITVYANLISVYVKNNQVVKTGEKIGIVYSGDGDNASVLHFEIWEESKKHDPIKWLKN